MPFPLLHLLLLFPLLQLLHLSPPTSAVDLYDNALSSTVFIARFRGNQFTSWGSGFFVDEGIVVTNRHVIELSGDYRVYGSTVEGVDLDCYKDVDKSNMRISLEDDIAYIRVFLDCDHGVVHFEDHDPAPGTPIVVLGYPSGRPDVLTVAFTGGLVLGKTDGPWIATSAKMEHGISGGPVVAESGKVVGTAVAKALDRAGNYLTGLFVPVSLIRSGLQYGNDSFFGYTDQDKQDNTVYALQSSSSSKRSAVSDQRSASSVSSRSSLIANRPSIPSVTFKDVSSRFYAFTEISLLKQRGIIQGYSDGTYRPHNSVNRAELLKILVEGFYATEIRGEENCFPDVRREWYARYVCAAKRLGWIGGYPDGTFRPGATVNRAEAIKIVTSSFAASGEISTDLPYDVPADAWYAPFTALGRSRGILTGNGPFQPGKDLTRADAAQWIARGIGGEGQ